jgi:hypothetical protein
MGKPLVKRPDPKYVVLYGLAKKDVLNPDLFRADRKLKPSVREALQRISDEFIYYIGDYKQAVKQVNIVGSAISYAWNKMSDIDLHLIFDPSLMDNCDAEVLRELLLAKKTIFNDKYEIKLFGLTVEVYPEFVGDINKSDYVYNLTENRWVKYKPKKEINVKKKIARDLFLNYKYIIDRLYQHDDDKVKWEVGTKVKERIKDMREQGLAEPKGNYSEKNIAFKTLRASGSLKKLNKLIDKSAANLLSLKKEED